MITNPPNPEESGTDTFVRSQGEEVEEQVEVSGEVEEPTAEEVSIIPEELGGWSGSQDSDDDMAQIYGSTRGIRRFSGVVGTIELDDFIIEFGGWCNGQAERRTGFNPYSTWQALFQHLEGTPMHDYAEFEVRFEGEIELFKRYWAPDFKNLFGGPLQV